MGDGTIPCTAYSMASLWPIRMLQRLSFVGITRLKYWLLSIKNQVIDCQAYHVVHSNKKKTACTNLKVIYLFITDKRDYNG